MPSVSRRDWLLGAGAAVGASLTPTAIAQDKPIEEPFRYCLNTSTISGQKLNIVQVVEIAGRAGYSAIEPWLRELDGYVKGGGNLKDLGKRIKDLGLTVESAIDFFQWLVDDDDRRKQGLENAKRSMDMVLQIGGKHIAAPPAGATDRADLSLTKVVERYRALLEIGANIGVIPELELWGPSKCLSRLSEGAFVTVESGHPQACLLLDIYHLYKGGSGYGGLRMLNGAAIPVIHMNDYPAQPPRPDITDAHRVYPGDGVAPYKDIFRDLRAIGFRGALSLELFNRDYWQKDALEVARTGLDKTRAAVKASMA